jgi:hypothetical protein
MESFFGSFLESFKLFILCTAVLAILVWAALDKGKGTTNEIWGLFGWSRKHVIGWTIYLCLAVAISGVVAYGGSNRTESQPSPLVGRHYEIADGFPHASNGSWDGIDPVIKQLLADKHPDDPGLAEIMSIDFVNEKEVELVYRGKTYDGRFTTFVGPNGNIQIETPAFPGGLSGEYRTYLAGPASYTTLRDGSRLERPRPTWYLLTLHSNEFTYHLDARPGDRIRSRAPEPPQ